MIHFLILYHVYLNIFHDAVKADQRMEDIILKLCVFRIYHEDGSI